MGPFKKGFISKNSHNVHNEKLSVAKIMLFALSMCANSPVHLVFSSSALWSVSLCLYTSEEAHLALVFV